MRFGQSLRHLARNRGLILICVFVTLIVLCIFSVYEFTQDSLNRFDERVAQAEKEDREQKKADREQLYHDLLTSPASGTTPEQISAVSIGMMAEEVKSILEWPYSLGFEIFPYRHASKGHTWVVNDIAIRDTGYVQAVFIDRQLVGLGSLDPSVGRLCGGCLDDMLSGKRGWLDGLPYQLEGVCPVCGLSKVVPFGATLDNLQKNLYH